MQARGEQGSGVRPEARGHPWGRGAGALHRSDSTMHPKTHRLVKARLRCHPPQRPFLLQRKVNVSHGTDQSLCPKVVFIIIKTEHISVE